jgi:NAD-dependent dihydropyrimidine dehydrogenase PreA subunit
MQCDRPQKKGLQTMEGNFLRGHIMAYYPEVNVEECTGCGECVDICPEDVYELQNDKSVAVNADECVGCESCIEVCENDALTISEI